MKDLIIIATEEYIDKWNQSRQTKIDYIPHKFDLKGKTAGQFWYHKNKFWFRWNLQLAEENSDDYLLFTVGHEVAHLIVKNIWPNAKPHGTEWKNVMQFLGLEAKRCHNYTVESRKRRKRPYRYLCSCGIEHELTAQKFKNMILRGVDKKGNTKYICSCKRYINVTKIKTIR